MIKTNNLHVRTVLKINPLKFKELLPAYELNIAANSLTIFKRIENPTPKEEVIYTEKTTLEIAFEAYSNHES
ncbi:hypothetical protein [Pedobacter mendelii]|uniref:Uncharacterized protein n=1 Tax=Pedobacter mendelii TaxID=1908240 RepID=A0ABQ2BD15_9SPHI|nr:hypothetical protein [Pedobacter mendelii]GGI23285.1 hypothetical protein GCM10008119_06900 [Pedobacter mendelii]